MLKQGEILPGLAELDHLYLVHAETGRNLARVSRVQSLICVLFTGRNLAIKKNATQGDETFQNSYGVSFTADRAVDGDTSTDLDDDESCSHTDRNGQTSWWTVHLGDNLTIWRLRVFNREDRK